MIDALLFIRSLIALLLLVPCIFLGIITSIVIIVVNFVLEMLGNTTEFLAEMLFLPYSVINDEENDFYE